jgi:hypothetical protein
MPTDRDNLTPNQRAFLDRIGVNPDDEQVFNDPATQNALDWIGSKGDQEMYLGPGTDDADIARIKNLADMNQKANDRAAAENNNGCGCKLFAIALGGTGIILAATIIGAVGRLVFDRVIRR